MKKKTGKPGDKFGWTIGDLVIEPKKKTPSQEKPSDANPWPRPTAPQAE